MIYTQETLDEGAVTIQPVVDAYNYIAGANLDPCRLRIDETSSSVVSQRCRILEHH